jgi:type I restriction enzyme R subunit
MDKKNLSERDICTKFITPALESAGWVKIQSAPTTYNKIIFRMKKGEKNRMSSDNT